MSNPQLDALTTEESLKQAIREGRELLKDFKQTLKEARELSTKLIGDAVEGAVQECVNEGVLALKEGFRRALKANEGRIYARFEIIETALFGDGHIKVPIDQMAKEKAEHVGHPLSTPEQREVFDTAKKEQDAAAQGEAE